MRCKARLLAEVMAFHNLQPLRIVATLRTCLPKRLHRSFLRCGKRL